MKDTVTCLFQLLNEAVDSSAIIIDVANHAAEAFLEVISFGIKHLSFIFIQHDSFEQLIQCQMHILSIDHFYYFILLAHIKLLWRAGAFLQLYPIYESHYCLFEILEVLDYLLNIFSIFISNRTEIL